jgi:isopenicillin N synthase-like dioxygenase
MEGGGPVASATTVQQPFDFAHLVAQHADQDHQKKDVTCFCEHLRQHGFVRVRLPEETSKTLQSMYDLSRRCFQQSQEYNQMKEYVYNPDQEVGYSCVRQLAKEFFAVRLNHVFSGLFKPDGYFVNDEFEEKATATFLALQEVAVLCLRMLAFDLKVDDKKLECLVDRKPLPRNSFSSSFLHVFKYEPQNRILEQCPPHTDSGLVTVIPCAETPGLEILDWQTYTWQKVEEGAAHPSDAVILLGETMARLTCCYYQASVHRVAKNPEETRCRYSLPFQLRGHPSAVIDSVGLDSSVIGSVPSSMREPITIAQFIQ